TQQNEGARECLAGYRRQGFEALQRRLDRGIAEGDLPEGTDTRTLAAYYTAVLQGLSIQARNGASRAELRAIADCAIAAWDTLVARHATAPGRSRGKRHVDRRATGKPRARVR
ncbi:MAG: hypothetical protein ACREE7_02445, partial [Dongiaceae bacterium]